jgi:Rrf2 family transcriptional regulator, iron-sulfur cluster assembly transcription factor
MFSKSCEYAIRSIIIICQNSKNGERTNVKEISAKSDAPEQYIAKLLQILTKENLIKSAKGPGGGFYMDKDHTKVKLIDVVNAIDGDSVFSGCGLGLKECSEKKPCPLHNHFKGIRNDLRSMLSKTSIFELANELHNGSFLKL